MYLKTAVLNLIVYNFTKMTCKPHDDEITASHFPLLFLEFYYLIFSTSLLTGNLFEYSGTTTWLASSGNELQFSNIDGIAAVDIIEQRRRKIF